jgi:hypothetical protein
VTFRNRLIFNGEELLAPSQQPLVGCPRLVIQYIRSYPPYLEAVSSSFGREGEEKHDCPCMTPNPAANHLSRYTISAQNPCNRIEMKRLPSQIHELEQKLGEGTVNDTRKSIPRVENILQPLECRKRDTNLRNTSEFHLK